MTVYTCEIKIHPYEEVHNINEITISTSHMRKCELSLILTLQPIYTNKDYTITCGENKKHLYNCDNHIDYIIRNPTINTICYSLSNEAKCIDTIRNMYKKQEKKFYKKVKSIKDTIKNSMRCTINVINILNNCLFNIDHLNNKCNFTP